ncbi:hypothetical protein KA093_03585 [Candidatus Saccharibacteria bacterium]|nr:hypothetical protein [Candidatus Saccharibacteria bacterium]
MMWLNIVDIAFIIIGTIVMCLGLMATMSQRRRLERSRHGRGPGGRRRVR